MSLTLPLEGLAQPAPDGRRDGEPFRPRGDHAEASHGPSLPPDRSGSPAPESSTDGPTAREAVVGFNPGYVFTKSNGTFPSGHGVELSLHAFPAEGAWTGVGVFGQLQSFGETTRYGGGVQASFMFLGVEAGAAHRGGDLGYGPRTTVHLGLYASMTLLNLGWRWDIPTSGSGPEPHLGTDRAFFVGVKLPFCIFRRGRLRFAPAICGWTDDTPAGP